MTGTKRTHTDDNNTEETVHEADIANGEPGALTDDREARIEEPEVGRDTPTGTDPEAEYEQPGFEDKSFGQAVEQDRELAEELDRDEPPHDAERRFDEEATGAPARQRQGNPETGPEEE